MARRKFKRAPEDLSQHDETWHVLSHHMRVWITPEFEEPYRPYVVLIFNLEQDLLQGMELVPHKPSAQEIGDILVKAMQKPPLSTGQKAHRPSRIQIEEAGWVTSLKPELAKLDIGVQQYPRSDKLNAAIADLEQHMRGEAPNIPGLLAVKGVTPQFLESIFSAAANFYRVAPWIHLTDQHLLAVQVPPEKEPRYLHIMGNAGIEYGLAMYRRLADAERVYAFMDNALEIMPEDGGNSFFFAPVYEIPVDDWDAVERYGWDVADEQAYPFPMIFYRDRKPQRPTLEDLRWYEGVLRAIPIFVQDHFLTHKGDPPSSDQPLEAVITVPLHSGDTEVSIKLPGGYIAALDRPAGAFDWADNDEISEDFPLFDRRAMEGSMQLFGPVFDEPKLNEAQQLMYQAFDEGNPAKRIILAHEALDISPNCADAYVLLAEEEADTVARALEYYEKGVEAGKRALGEEFFEENEGHFWMALETRPYMRARQGLANTLWDLHRDEEAAGHFREMLILNPGDNQGVRYSLLNLLVTSDHDDEALKLIKQYDDDGMAEWAYTHALLNFRSAGAGKKANKLLRDAYEINTHVPDYLTGRKRIPVQPPSHITWGGEDEAVTYAAGYLNAWRKTTGAVAWLKEQVPDKSGGKKTKRD